MSSIRADMIIPGFQSTDDLPTNRPATFTERLDDINIDPAAGNDTDEVKTELRSLIRENAPQVTQFLETAAENINSRTVDRLAKIAFAFAPETDNEQANTAIRILGNAVQNAGPQLTFQITARLEQIETHTAQDAVKQAGDRAQHINASEIDRSENEATLAMLHEFREETPGLKTKPAVENSLDRYTRQTNEMLHNFRAGQ